MRFLIIFIFLLSNSFADETMGIKNLVIHKELKKYDDLTFLDPQKKQLNMKEYHGHLILLNFWASWCVPCKEEMPSLDILQVNGNLDNLKIFPINVGKDDIDKILSFYSETGIQNLNFYFDSPKTLAKKFKLRGIPTSILINKDGLEFARIVGSTDFKDEKFIEWLSYYN